MSAIECAFFAAVGSDAERKVSKAGKPYLRFSARCGDSDNAEWVSILSFDPQAIELADKLVKGARVYIEGRLSTSEWTGQDGTKRLGLSVMSWHTRLAQIGRNKAKGRTEKASCGDARSTGNTFYSDEIPFAPEIR